jgi:predicted amidohydrolase YtcJ
MSLPSTSFLVPIQQDPSDNSPELVYDFSDSQIPAFAVNEAILSRRHFLKLALTSVPVLTGGLGSLGFAQSGKNVSPFHADLIVINGKTATLAQGKPFAQALAVRDGQFISVAENKEVMQLNGLRTQVIDANKRTIIPGVNDSHTHVIRGGLNYNMEFRWDGVPSLSIALDMLREQARRTPPPQNIERIKKLGGGIAVQHRMAYQGEYFIKRYGKRAATTSPPLHRMLEMGVPIGGGTDATRVSGYSPWVTLYWLTAGKTIGGTPLYDKSNRLDRMEALKLMAHGSAWFAREQHVKGTIEPSNYADFAVLSEDYFSVPEEKIKNMTSVMTVTGGKLCMPMRNIKNTAPQSFR